MNRQTTAWPCVCMWSVESPKKSADDGDRFHGFDLSFSSSPFFFFLFLSLYACVFIHEKKKSVQHQCEWPFIQFTSNEMEFVTVNKDLLWPSNFLSISLFLSLSLSLSSHQLLHVGFFWIGFQGLIFSLLSYYTISRLVFHSLFSLIWSLGKAANCIRG